MPGKKRERFILFSSLEKSVLFSRSDHYESNGVRKLEQIKRLEDLGNGSLGSVVDKYYGGLKFEVTNILARKPRVRENKLYQQLEKYNNWINRALDEKANILTYI